MKNASLASNLGSMIASALEISGIKVIAQTFDGASIDDLKVLADTVRNKVESSIVVFASSVDGKAALLVAAAKSALDKGADAGAVIKKIAPIVGGGGGGRKDMAQAGGKDPSKIKDAVAEGIAALKGMVR